MVLWISVWFSGNFVDSFFFYILFEGETLMSSLYEAFSVQLELELRYGLGCMPIHYVLSFTLHSVPQA